MDEEKGRILKLRLELQETAYPDVQDVLWKYGKVKEGIIREVLVPETLTLYQLHYVIQNAFGWQNSHLHHFSLPEKVFKKVTEDRFSEWGKFCGVLFRFPSDDFEDTYWWDDFDGTESVDDWMRNKYRFPMPLCRGRSEQFLEAQSAYRNMLAENPVVRRPISFAEYMDRKEGKNQKPKPVFVPTGDLSVRQMQQLFAEGGGMDELLERLPVGRLMAKRPRVPKDKLNALADFADSVFAEHASEVSGKRKESSNRRRPSDAYVRKMCACNPEVFPLTNVLSYEYDYGDGWEVEIRLLDEYAGDIGGIPDLPEEQRRLLEKGQPVCVFADGLPVMDDVGGVWGYCEFLETLHDPYADPEEREWARDMGWTGRLKSPKNIL